MNVEIKRKNAPALFTFQRHWKNHHHTLYHEADSTMYTYKNYYFSFFFVSYTRLVYVE